LAVVVMNPADDPLAGQQDEISAGRAVAAGMGQAVDDGLTRDEALSELRGRPVPWQETPEKP
jgi:hypothetical protein